ncbi:MAG: nitronate monooxygenase [Ignavibacterium sp.]|jgi:enoyl-[acyl-carrier protein] reductase II|nr:MAG: nitronate monooxygenase [Ignavibacterium sp.]MDD5608588.1 nitronate monooxygenase [Ignavibacterium sp.]MDX9711303.1 nitronate monooxygenase [Ignavibacteriaceae bacterium]MEB2355171.1 nitronate monooxygenase [Ignavibacteriales bacterium]
MKTKITDLLNIKYPIIQAGMVWVSGWKLVSAVSNEGGLGLIGAGSMKPDLLKEHIKKCNAATDKPFGVNIPLLRKDADELVKASLDEGIKIFFTSAGNPKTFTSLLKEKGCTVVHVVANLKYGIKAQEAGCDAVVGEGVEAGGHNGTDQITTFCLIPQLVDKLNIPVIAAGGIADGRGILAALSLGAEGVQIGTRFAATVESSAHQNFKDEIVKAGDQGTVLAFKKIGLVRIIKNDFAIRAMKAESEGWNEIQLRELLATKRERIGIFEGDLIEGELEAGQGVGLINDIPTVKELFERLLNEIEITNRKNNNLYKG